MSDKLQKRRSLIEGQNLQRRRVTWAALLSISLPFVLIGFTYSIEEYNRRVYDLTGPHQSPFYLEVSEDEPKELPAKPYVSPYIHVPINLHIPVFDEPFWTYYETHERLYELARRHVLVSVLLVVSVIVGTVLMVRTFTRILPGYELWISGVLVAVSLAATFTVLVHLQVISHLPVPPRVRF